jgi:hypothetical protein
MSGGFDADPRRAALLMLVPNPQQRELAASILQSLEALEQIDFGELEPVGVGAPRAQE